MGTFGRQILSTTGRPLQISADGRPEWKAGGITLDWSQIAAVSAETTLADGTVVANGDKYLRYGAVLGKITSGGKYAPSVLGVTTAAYAQGETEITVSAATAAELVARQGSSGTFKLHGATTSGGTARTLTVTYSAVDTSTGAITVTAIGSAADDEAISVAETTQGVAAVSAVDDIQTMTFQDGADGGTFALRYRGLATAALAFNITTGDLQTAVRALHADLATTVVTSVGGAGVDYVFTTPGVAVVDLELTQDLILDGATAEAASITHTQQGFVAVSAVTEVQTITISGSATGGTFRVGYIGEQTPELAYNISTANLQTALQALTGLGSATVAGTAGSSYVITFTGVSGDVALLDLDATLTGTPGPFESGSLVMPTDGSELFTKGETFILNESVVYSEPGSDHPAVLDGGLVFNARIKDTGDLLQGLLDTALPRLKLLRETN